MTQERGGDSTLWFPKEEVKGQSSEGLGKRTALFLQFRGWSLCPCLLFLGKCRKVQVTEVKTGHE